MIKCYINILPLYKKELLETAKKVIKGENIKGELSITIIDDERMKYLNKKYKKKKGTTDVISFYFKEDEKFETISGDIYISIEQASKQKKGGLIKELKLLLIHGLLHIAGYNDDTYKNKAIMRRKEKFYL